MFTRRELLKRGLLLAPALPVADRLLVRSLLAAGGGGRKLIFVELRGGNDALNTVVPYGLNGGTYYSTFRPTLHVPYDSLLPIDDRFAFHPAWQDLAAHFAAGRLAVLQGVSWPGSSFSHAQAQRVMATGDPSGQLTSGWFGRYLATQGPGPEKAFEVGSFLPQLFQGAGGFVPAFPSLSQIGIPADGKHPGDAKNRRAAYAALCQNGGGPGAAPLVKSIADNGDELLDAVAQYSDVGTAVHALIWPKHPLANALKMVVRLLKSGLGFRYHHVLFEGFDSHADQELANAHSKRLKVLDGCLNALQMDLTTNGLAHKTIVLVYSEFGRAVYENASGGTDHGTAGTLFVLGNKVHGGLTTPHPDLEPGALTDDGELVGTTDFRDVFATILARWLDADPAAVFPGHAWQDLGFLGG